MGRKYTRQIFLDTCQRLLAVDDLPWLVTARDRLVGKTLHPTGLTHVARPTLKHWLECPWCSGLWLSGAGYALWRWLPGVAEPAIIILAASTVAGVIVRNLDPTED